MQAIIRRIFIRLFIFSILLQKTDLVFGRYDDNFYTAEDKIVELTNDNFEDEVLNSEKVWLVEFFAPLCSYSRTVLDDIAKLGRMEREFEIGAVDGSNIINEELLTKYNIEEYPTFLIFGTNKDEAPKAYEEGITATEINNAINKL